MNISILPIPHCRALTGGKHDASDSDTCTSYEKAIGFALLNNYNIIVHTGRKAKYYFGRRDIDTMTNLHSVTVVENPSAFKYTTWVIRRN